MAASKRVVLGMSGGVDSSVAAALLMQLGYDVIGATCVFCDGDAADAAVTDAKGVCDQLGIRHVVQDCRQDFDGCVIQPFIEGYACGLTPIPCVGCNATCKFPALLQVADKLECRYVSSGHYARICRMPSTQRYAVACADDARKDQSYMLSMLSQEQLSRIVLPLGALTKDEVRAKAANLGLRVAHRPESQDVCFIEGDYRDFLTHHGLQDAPGEIVDASGYVLGHHSGLFNYTVGQRKGIGIAAAQPYYVIGKRIAENQLVVGFEDEAKISRVIVRNVVWQAIEAPTKPIACSVKLRYRAHAIPCTVRPLASASASAVADTVDAVSATVAADPLAIVKLDISQPTTAPGQCAVFFRDGIVLGSATIESITSAITESANPAEK